MGETMISLTRQKENFTMSLMEIIVQGQHCSALGVLDPYIKKKKTSDFLTRN